ncbi:MAG: hypothetical protein WC175_05085 [Candidatus Dojkabacteria bacterium]
MSDIKRTSWNKGLTKETDERVKKTSETCKKLAKDGKFGGYRKGSGRGKSGWYKGFFCDSSWELAYVIYCLEHNIKIERNTKRFKYEFENKIHEYIPDFIVEGQLIEIKGYNTKQWQAKLSAVPDVKVLYEKELKCALDYTIDKYGKEFITMYDGYKPKLKVKKSDILKKINEEKKKNKANKILQHQINRCHNTAIKINNLIDSNIDFTKNGWVGQAAKILNSPHQHTREWIKRNYPKLLINAYTKKYGEVPE